MSLHTHIMDKPETRRRLDDMVQGLVGKPLDRPDGPKKVSGQAPYAHEWALANTAYGVLARAPFTKGKITAINQEELSHMPGVVAVIDDDRLLRNPAQGTANKAPVQGSKTIDYFGQPALLIVAETFEQARHAAQTAKFEYDAETAIVDPQSDKADIEVPDDKQLSQGDFAKAFDAASVKLDQVYTTPGQNSAAMEPHASVAVWDNEKLILRGSYQMLKYNRNEIADALGMDPENVQILSPYVGGGFGSKLGIAPEAVAAALAAKQLERPVLVALTRPQVFEATMRRSETRQHIRLGADEDGRLSALSHESLVSNLPDEAFSEPVEQATHFTYAAAHRQLARRVARIHRNCAGSVRAPGEAVGVFAFECAIDELADAAGIDPIEIRLRNIPEQHPEKNIPFSLRQFSDCLESGSEKFGWNARPETPRSRQDGEWYVGYGMASAVRVNILSESEARVTLNADGTVTVETDMTDIGTGTYAILSQIAGDMLGVPMDKIETRLGDTSFPPASGSGGSWGAASAGSSVFLACESIRNQLADRLSCEESDLTLKDGQAITDNKTVDIKDLLDGVAIGARGRIEPGETSDAVGQAGYGAVFAEVGVNNITGEIRVRRLQGTFSAGRILNEKTARSQCIGGLTWGVGMALMEELMHDPRTGHIVNHNLAEYHIPVNLDVPQIDITFLDGRDDWANPLQAKGIGELALCGSPAAVINAIYNACGVRVRDFPATLDKIFPHLD